MRHDGRKAQELRKLELQTNVFKYPEGSVVIRFGDTTVICSATIEDSVPPFLRETGTGWVTAEYSMLPRATSTRNRRESSKGKLSGRTMEIQRLIGRSLRHRFGLPRRFRSTCRHESCNDRIWKIRGDSRNWRRSNV